MPNQTKPNETLQMASLCILPLFLILGQIFLLIGVEVIIAMSLTSVKYLPYSRNARTMESFYIIILFQFIYSFRILVVVFY